MFFDWLSIYQDFDKLMPMISETFDIQVDAISHQDDPAVDQALVLHQGLAQEYHQTRFAGPGGVPDHTPFSPTVRSPFRYPAQHRFHPEGLLVPGRDLPDFLVEQDEEPDEFQKPVWSQEALTRSSPTSKSSSSATEHSSTPA